MQLASLGSGSKGNSTLIRCGECCVVVDCGFSLLQFEKRLARLDISAQDIDAILVTHEHADHGSGVARLSARYDIPLYMTVGTARALDIYQFEPIHGAQSFSLGPLLIQPVTVPHDSAEPVQFVFTEIQSGRKLGVLTDSGHITSHMKQVYRDCDGLLLEFNYDEQMLHQGPYPQSLKQRVAGSFGHLSNNQSMELLRALDTRKLSFLIAAHISEKNNSADLVAKLLEDLSFTHEPVLACQQRGFAWQKL